MSDKIQNSIYLLRNIVKEKHPRTKKTNEHSVNFDYLSKFLKKKDYKEQKIKQDICEDYDIKVFYKKLPNDAKWKDFITAIVLEGEDILKPNKSVSESYCIFIKNKNTNKIFASTGGYGHIALQDISTNDFGLEILSRIVTSDDKALKSTKERSLTGGVQGEVKFFRNDHNLYENESFGKVYNELNASIKKDNLVNIFGFRESDLKGDSICVVKNSFSLKKSISFNQLLTIVRKCEYLLDNVDPIVEINSVEKVNKSEGFLIDDLLEAILVKIYDNYLNPDKFYSVEISNKEFEKYFYAVSSDLNFNFKRKKKTKKIDDVFREIQLILSLLKEDIGEDLDYEEFKKIIYSSYIETYDENDKVLTRDKLISHFCAEINHTDDNTYFLIEKDWYRIKKTFIDNINEQTSHFINENKYRGSELKKWVDTDTENDFNASHLEEDKTFVFDKITYANIEICDIMKIEGEIVYFYHVKKGFDNSMRDLCNQILIASRKMIEDVRMNYQYLESLYDKAVNNKGETEYYQKVKKQFEHCTKDQFINLIRNKKSVFVLAVLDTGKTERSLYENIDKFESNIAKFTLNELAKGMRNLGMPLEILQLKSSEEE